MAQSPVLILSLSVRNQLGTKQQAPNPAADIVDQQESDDDDSRQLQYGDLVALLGHAGQAAGTALNARAHVAEDLVRVVEGVLAARIVVDVQGDVFQRRGLLREGREERIVLSECEREWSIKFHSNGGGRQTRLTLRGRRRLTC
jgi:hypothetical protein